MKKSSIFILLLFSLIIAGCSQSKEKQQSEKEKDTISANETESKSLRDCYLSVIAKDSAKLELEILENHFTGFLSYFPYEKDSSFGVYSGTIKGDTLNGIFSYLSEGMLSETEKIFLLKDDKLSEGIGDLKLKNDKRFVFRDPHAVTFGKSYVFKKVECKENFISKETKDFYFRFRPEN